MKTHDVLCQVSISDPSGILYGENAFIHGIFPKYSFLELNAIKYSPLFCLEAYLIGSVIVAFCSYYLIVKMLGVV